jgi:16S rRNA (cytosine1402-N4)-methyltransferase
MEMYHKPVLLEESIIGLRINPNGIYVDATFGGGGHSKEILSQLNSSGRLIAFDQDQDAIENKLLDKRLNLVKSNFKYLSNYLNYFHIK